jgi:glycosyltransferase involved in cell wall biosynthesis
MSEQMKDFECNLPDGSPITHHRSLLSDASAISYQPPAISCQKSPITDHRSLPHITVVIATLNRPQLLHRCLGALCDQTLRFPAYEIVVVDDGPHRATKAVVHEWRLRCPEFGVRYRCSAEAHGPGAARNVGWRAARSAVIAFTDDDCIPASQWLEAGVRRFSQPDVGALWGRILVPLTDQHTDWERNVAGLERAPCATANCFYRREVLETLGGFDERFTEAWREDSDLQFQAIARGVTIVHEPQAVVTHPVRPAPWGVSIALQRQNRFNALLYKKHPRLYGRFNPHEPPWSYYATVTFALLGLLAAYKGAAWLAAIFWSGWIVMAGKFCLRRLRGATHRPAHVMEMIVTSLIIPPYAVFWRLYGAFRYRVAFL